MKVMGLKKMSMLIGIIFIVGVHGYYLVNVYSKNQVIIDHQVNEIKAQTEYLAKLETGLKQLPESKGTLEGLKAQLEAMKSTIPNVISDASLLAGLYNSFDASKFYDVQVIEESSLAAEDEVIPIVQKDYAVSFTSYYHEVKTFIENLNAAYQIIHINSIQIDNQLQLTENQEALEKLKNFFGEDLSEVVTIQLRFSVYVREDVSEEQEAYVPSLTIINSNNKPFDSVSFANRLEEEVQGEKNVTLPFTINADRGGEYEEIQYLNSTFELYIEDILTSGDTYKLVGPGKEKQYLGLVTQSNAYITITIDDAGYAFSMKDENGNVKQITCEEAVQRPVLYINSSMQQVQNAMPHVHIYIYNYGDDEIKVGLKGSLLSHIHIYDHSDQEVQVGETKGNVKLMAYE